MIGTSSSGGLVGSVTGTHLVVNKCYFAANKSGGASGTHWKNILSNKHFLLCCLSLEYLWSMYGSDRWTCLPECNPCFSSSPQSCSWPFTLHGSRRLCNKQCASSFSNQIQLVTFVAMLNFSSSIWNASNPILSCHSFLSYISPTTFQPTIYTYNKFPQFAVSNNSLSNNKHSFNFQLFHPLFRQQIRSPQYSSRRHTFKQFYKPQNRVRPFWINSTKSHYSKSFIKNIHLTKFHLSKLRLRSKFLQLQLSKPQLNLLQHKLLRCSYQVPNCRNCAQNAPLFDLTQGQFPLPKLHSRRYLRIIQVLQPPLWWLYVYSSWNGSCYKCDWPVPKKFRVSSGVALEQSYSPFTFFSYCFLLNLSSKPQFHVKHPISFPQPLWPFSNEITL